MIDMLLRDLIDRVGRARRGAARATPGRQARRVDVTRARRGEEQGAHRPAAVTSTVPDLPAGWRVAAHPRPAGVRHARGARAPGRQRGRVELAAPPQGSRPAARRRPGRGRARQRHELVDREPVRDRLALLRPRLGAAVLRRARPGRGRRRRSSSGRSSSRRPRYLQFHETLRAPGGVLAESARPRPLGVAGGLEAAPDRLLGGAGPAGGHGVLQHQHLLGDPGGPDAASRHGTWSGRRTCSGPICFLVASWFAYAEVNRGVLPRSDRSVGWRIAALNMLGSIAFGVSAVAARYVPSTGELGQPRAGEPRHVPRRGVLPRRRRAAAGRVGEGAIVGLTPQTACVDDDPIARLLADPPDLPVRDGLADVVAALRARGRRRRAGAAGHGQDDAGPAGGRRGGPRARRGHPAAADRGTCGRAPAGPPARRARRPHRRVLRPGREHRRAPRRGSRWSPPGVLLRRLQRDPELPGVAAVVLDEVHERHLVDDLTLALLVDVRAHLRDDLVVVAMSATVEAERTAALLGGTEPAPGGRGPRCPVPGRRASGAPRPRAPPGPTSAG